MSLSVPRYYFLYADDDPDDQLLFREIVRQAVPQYEVVVCEQGLELLQFLEARRPGDDLPCCVVLDMNMPIWDGIKTLRELKTHKLYKDLPVVMFTTSQSLRDKTLCEELGADGFFSKPVTHVDVERTIKAFRKIVAAD